jgi:hypothetical protein
VFGAIVGTGLRAATGCATGGMGIGSRKGVVGGLSGVPSLPSRHLSSQSSPLNCARALSPFLWIRYPALVSRPAFIMSRRLNCALIISRRFFAAFIISRSRLLFLFEMFAIGDFSFENAWPDFQAKAWMMSLIESLLKVRYSLM